MLLNLNSCKLSFSRQFAFPNIEGTLISNWPHFD